MRILQALSSSSDIQEKISASIWAEIIGVYEQALNLQLSDGSIIGVVEREAGNCPGNIVISSFCGLTSKIKAGDRVFIYPSSLRIGEIMTISLEGMNLWNPQIELHGELCPPSRINEKILNFLEMEIDLPLNAETLLAKYHPWASPTSPSLWKELWERHMVKHILGLCCGLIEENREIIKNEFSQVIGAGPGLTPSGDDILVGIFGTLYPLLCRLGKYPPALPIWPSSEWVKGTTPLGGALVSCSLRGEIAQRVRNVIIGILSETGDMEKHLPSLLGMGATSGKDTFMGILLGTVLGLEIGMQN